MGNEKWYVNPKSNDTVIIEEDQITRIFCFTGSKDRANLVASAQELQEALEDMLSGWRYIREVHGDLYGVGWERAETKAIIALAKSKGRN